MNPVFSNPKEENGGRTYRFTLSGLNVSLANALRRVVLSDIPINVIKTETYNDNQCKIIQNTSRIHNEIVKQRLSCIPIHLKELDLLPGKYQLEVDVSNDTENILYVTTEDFRIRNKLNGNYLTADETGKIFPPCSSTLSYIDFLRLRPKISDTIPGEKINLVADFSVSTARQNSSFNVVSKCSYGNTPDMVKINEELDKLEAKLKTEEKTEDEIRFIKKNFMLLDAERIYVADSFDFVVETIGIYTNHEIMSLASEILYQKFEDMVRDIDSNIIQIVNSETTIDFCFDLLIENEDYTVGKVIEYILYEKYYLGDKTLSFCGFKKFHPHDNGATVRLAFSQMGDKTLAKQYVRNSCIEAQNIYKKIKKFF